MHDLAGPDVVGVGADAPGAVLVVVGVVLFPVAGVPSPVVVDVVDGEVPVDPVDPVGLVVVVVVLHVPRSFASRPHVDAVASVRSNEAFSAAFVDERCDAGAPTTITVTAKRRASKPPTGKRTRRNGSAVVARTRVRARAVLRFGRRGTQFSLRGRASSTPSVGPETLFLAKNCEKCGHSTGYRDNQASVRPPGY